jgi:arabinoxylan arabinofuranohydrolase
MLNRFAIGLILFGALTMSAPLPAAVVKGKPLLPDFHADPSAREFHGKYYLYCTHDLATNNEWHSEDFHAFSSTDLAHWKDEGIIFSKKDVAWANVYLWAPDCIERNGRYYLYYGATEGGPITIGVAVSDSPAGPFKDPLGHPLVAHGENPGGRSMDPCIFIDDDGQAYLYIGGGEHFAVVKLKSDMITRDGPIIPLNIKDGGEGPWVHKRDGLYYMSYPTGTYAGPSQNQVMMYSTATNPLGPWQPRGPILLDNGGGNVHGSIAKFGSQWYLFYHVEGLSIHQRRACAEYLYYNEDGTIKPIVMTAEGVVLKR